MNVLDSGCVMVPVCFVVGLCCFVLFSSCAIARLVFCGVCPACAFLLLVWAWQTCGKMMSVGNVNLCLLCTRYSWTHALKFVKEDKFFISFLFLWMAYFVMCMFYTSATMHSRTHGTLSSVWCQQVFTHVLSLFSAVVSFKLPALCFVPPLPPFLY